MLEETINISVGGFTNHAVWSENKNLGFHKFLRFRQAAPYFQPGPRISDPGPVSYSTPVRLDPNTSYFLGKTQSLFFENPPNISGQNISKYFKDTNYFYPIKDCLYKITT